ncbi:AGE family epimerase/isomerase [Maribacter sp. HTCC2170]|uniref:AGE family epimerase/isomerase n=1 Tax=Maribacter sp. (strain HTCC2170 / KCCM 42371) TaxID=313603 RepID=UPI00006B47C7|nr:AGE family epimerase/isomerase [Maribacter sp. HTCC2170]EAR01804.1 hypothetical protein FB2170_14788 [Maribacter sp. HTCC2170]
MTLDDSIEISAQLEIELTNILDYWQNNTKDAQFGGFHGQINNDNEVIKKANKGIILNTRILWTFSRASNFYSDKRYDDECKRAFNYLFQYFNDKEYGGVFWEVDYEGNPANKRKQSYAQAFCIYALAEYYKYSRNNKALSWALEIYQLLETKAYSLEFDAYIEAFDKDWSPIEDLRLSEKDLNAPITTNTHLHILEAYTTLYEVSKNPEIKTTLKGLMSMFTKHIVTKNHQLKLFFDTKWQTLSSEISFGHDIEVGWLLLKAAETINDSVLVEKNKNELINISDTFIAEALDEDYGVWNSKDGTNGEVDMDKHWWPQAEAMVGLIYTWKITKDKTYYNTAIQIWRYIKKHIIDHKNGEWFFRVNPEGKPYAFEDKVGPWKGPYHNSRALIEVLKKLSV